MMIAPEFTRCCTAKRFYRSSNTQLKAILSCDAFPLSRHCPHEPRTTPSRLQLPALGPTPAILRREQRMGKSEMDDTLLFVLSTFYSSERAR